MVLPTWPRMTSTRPTSAWIAAMSGPLALLHRWPPPAEVLRLAQEAPSTSLGRVTLWPLAPTTSTTSKSCNKSHESPDQQACFVDSTGITCVKTYLGLTRSFPGPCGACIASLRYGRAGFGTRTIRATPSSPTGHFCAFFPWTCFTRSLLEFLTIPFFVIRFDLCLYFFFIDFTAMHTAEQGEMYMYEKPRAMMVPRSNDRGF